MTKDKLIEISKGFVGKVEVVECQDGYFRIVARVEGFSGTMYKKQLPEAKEFKAFLASVNKQAEANRRQEKKMSNALKYDEIQAYAQ